MRKVLVTGASGLVGSHLLIELSKQELEITALYRNEVAKDLVIRLFDYYNVKANLTKVNWVKADITSPETLEGLFLNIETVYHAAALVSFEKKDADRLYKTNVIGTQHVIDQVLKNKIKTLAFISSVASIRNTNKEGFFIENGVVDGEREWTDYAQSKAKSEELILATRNKGVKTVIVNPGVILGPSEITKSSTAIFNTIKEGLSFYTLGINGFVDVRDVVDAVLALEKLSETKERYVCVGHNVAFKTVFDILAKDLKVKPPRFKANKIMLAIAWRIEFLTAKLQRRSPKLTKDNTRSALEIIRYDASLLKDELNFSFRSLESASKNTTDFFV